MDPPISFAAAFKFSPLNWLICRGEFIKIFTQIKLRPWHSCNTNVTHDEIWNHNTNSSVAKNRPYERQEQEPKFYRHETQLKINVPNHLLHIKMTIRPLHPSLDHPFHKGTIIISVKRLEHLACDRWDVISEFLLGPKETAIRLSELGQLGAEG